MKYDKSLVEVVWLDAETTHGWETDDETDLEQVPIVTIGFLIAKGEHIVVVASSIDKTTGTNNNSRIKIPIAMIESVKELNVSYKKARKDTQSHQESCPSDPLEGLPIVVELDEKTQ